MRAVQVPATIALILCIVGATSANTPGEIYAQTTVHIGIILFAVVLFALIILTIGAGLGWRTTHRGEGAIIAAVALALPFLTVRILYSLLAVFSHDAKFNAVTGSTTIDLFMAVLTEAVVVLIYLICGLKVMNIPESQQSDSTTKNLSYRLGRGDFGTGKLGILSLGVAVVQALNGKKGNDDKGKTQGGPQYAQHAHRHHHGATSYTAHPQKRQMEAV